MFSVVELKFNVVERVFNVAEHKFNDAEHNILLCKDTSLLGHLQMRVD